MFDPERFLSGDGDYAAAVIREHHGYVLAVCRSFARTDDETEDLAQEAWRSVVAHARSYSGEGSFRSWLHRIAVNACLTEARTRRTARDATLRYTTELSAGAHPGASDPHGYAERRELSGVIHRALAELTDGERTAVTLRVLEGRRAKEVARIMGVTPATVRSHLRHGLNRLRRIMEDPDSDLSRYRATS